MRGIRVSLSIKQEVLESYVAGELLAVLSSKYRLHRGTIRRWAKDAGVSRTHADTWRLNRENGIHHPSYKSRRKPRTFKTPDKEATAYIVGFFDGEGTLGFRRNGHSNQSVFLSIVNTRLEPLEFIRHCMGGGTINGPYVRKGSLGKKPQYTWRVSSNSDIVFFLKTVYPYLKCKKEVADLVFARLEM